MVPFIFVLKHFHHEHKDLLKIEQYCNGREILGSMLSVLLSVGVGGKSMYGHGQMRTRFLLRKELGIGA